MCGGPTDTQSRLQSEEADFYATQISAYNTAYSSFKGIQDTLNAQFAPILAKGPNQMGFSDAELTDLNTKATEGTAQSFAKAKQALQQGQAAEGGGTSNVNLTSGVSGQQNEELAATGAATSAASRLAIQEAGYAQGYDEWKGAVAGEEDLAAGWNPNSFGGTANSSAGVANSEANTIAAQQNSIWTSVMGALGGVASNVTYGAGKGWGLG